MGYMPEEPIFNQFLIQLLESYTSEEAAEIRLLAKVRKLLVSF
jgi:hypothetical protein